MTAALPFRIGEGWDTHQLVEGRPLILGGVTVAHTHGLLGHSDADALCHAVTDALFGAAGLGDIGRHFPDTDAAFKGADSIALLAECARRQWAVLDLAVEDREQADGVENLLGEGEPASERAVVVSMTLSGPDVADAAGLIGSTTGVRAVLRSDDEVE